MSYLALYRKYRPSSFDDFVGQNEVSNIIKNEILNNKISHAYLFSGPRGTGKTSTAKIIARMINCSNISKDGIPCGKCDSCLNFNSNDVVEIDAASNNGVDEIRELRDKVNLVPSSGKYKIYIIDEVHMLTTQAFNALLKTLEEPPTHVIFILATTEFYKIPATVVSRCQKFQFLKFSNEEIVERLKFICKNEKIDVSDDVKFEIARIADGGLSDAINMLDHLSSFMNGEFDVDDVYKLNGVVSFNDISNLLNFVISGDIKSIVLFVESLNKKGVNLEKFVFDFVNYLKDLLIFRNDSSYVFNNSFENDSFNKISDKLNSDMIYKIIIIFNDVLIQMKNSGFSMIILSSNLVKLTSMFNNKNDINLLNSDEHSLDDVFINKNNENSKDIINDKSKANNDYVLSYEVKKIRINNAFYSASKVNKENFVFKWNDLKDNLNSVKYSNLIGIIDDIDVMVVGDNNVIFSVRYDSLLDRIYDYLNDFEDMLFDFYNIKYSVVFLDNDEWEYEKNNYISNIKSGKKYCYIEEIIEKKDNNVYTNNDVDKLITIVGNDVISYK